MKANAKTILYTVLLGALPLWSQGTYTAASCSRSDVNAVINGPTHTAIDGDVIQIPAGTCTWTSGIIVSSGVGITIQGSGTPNTSATSTGASSSCTATVITDNSNSHLFQFRPDVTSSLSRISCIKIRTDGSSSINAPLSVAGRCNSTTCSNFRIDNITIDASLQGQLADSGSQVLADNVFGVLDHNSVAGSNFSRGLEFLSYNHSAWNGVGDYGDNSWASAVLWYRQNYLHRKQ